MDGRKYGVLSCRPGFLLAEALVILFLVSLAGTLTFPSIRSWQEEKELDLAAETLAAAIRQVQVLSKNDTGRYGNTANEYYFFCLPDAKGEVIYYTRRGVSRMEPEGKLPASIRARISFRAASSSRRLVSASVPPSWNSGGSTWISCVEPAV